MSKEKQCECCHEWWYDSDVKENLCPNCYYYFKQLKQQLEEKGKEINIKNNKLAELKKELTICKDKLRRKTQSNRDLQHRVHNVNTQLAIQELEKVEEWLEPKYFDYEQINYLTRIIDNQIKELKGEK